MSPAIAADAFRNLDDETRDKLRALPSNDDVFADAMRHSRVVLGESGVPDRAAAAAERAAAGRHRDAWRQSAALSCSNFPGLLRDVPVLEQAASGRGLPPSAPSATASCGACRWSWWRRA